MTVGEEDRAGRRPDRAALAIAGLLAAVGLAIAVSTSWTGGVAIYSPVGPKTVPFIVGGGLLLVSGFTVFAALRGDFPEREPLNLPPIAWVLGGLVFQMLTMKTVGFSIATGVLFAATARGLGRGPLWFTVPVGIVFAFIVWFIFARGLQLTLPAGPIERLF